MATCKPLFDVPEVYGDRELVGRIGSENIATETQVN